ncbi:MAG TPA: OmpW family outer membrane protein [Steroidobacteraceae bacterium]
MFPRVAATVLCCCVVASAALAPVPAHADAKLDVTTAFSTVLADLTAAAKNLHWLERRAGIDPMNSDARVSRSSMHLFVQEDGLGGADVVTVRYPLLAHGVFRTFLGAGLGRAEYYEERGAETYAVPLAFRDTHHDLGAVAEIGSEWNAGEQLRVNASVRWSDVANDARALRTDNGPVGAQPLVIGLALGYRFR